MTKKWLLVNPLGGRAKNQHELEAFLAATRQLDGLEVHLFHKGEDVSYLVKQALARGAEIIGAAGGDGTLNSVASALVGTKIPFVVVPFGTLNHFARDLGLQYNSPAEALKLFEAGQSQAVDVGEVNGLYFLNNSSVGIYPRLVKQRERYEKRLGKPLAYLLAAWNVLRSPRTLNVRLDLAGQTQDLEVGLVFFSNNLVNMSPVEAGRRPRLDDGKLDAYVVKAASLFGLFRVTASFLRNRLTESPLVVEAHVVEAVIYSRRSLRVACDGEVRRLSSPLRYRIHRAALLVRVPSSATPE